MKNTHVYFAIPTRGNDLYWRLAVYLLAQKDRFEEMTLGFAINGWQAASEELFKHIVTCPTDFVQWLDADIGPAHDTTARLVRRNVDIITAPVWMYDPKNNDIHLNVLPSFGDESRLRRPKRNGIERMEQCSFAALLLRRNVIQTFADANEPFCTWTSFLDESWKVYPPDVIFCRKAQKLGFEIYVDWEIPPAEHHKHVALGEDTIEQFFVNRVKEIYGNGTHGADGSENRGHRRERLSAPAEC